MRFITKVLRKRRLRYLLDNYYQQLWYRYHNSFFCSLIFRGLKLKAFNQFIFIKSGLKLKESRDPYLTFLVALMVVTPNISLLSLRLAGRMHGVPMPITESRKISLGIRLVFKALRASKKRVSVKNMVDMLLSSISGNSVAIEKKMAMYELGIKNRHLMKFFR